MTNGKFSMLNAQCSGKPRPCSVRARRPLPARHSPPQCTSAALPLILLVATMALSLALLPGCVSKARAQAQARAAFVAGEQQAMQNIEKLRYPGPTISVVGPVQNPVLPWSNGLTLDRAVVDARYLGPIDPTQILVVRSGQATPYDPKALLKGQDVPLQPRDVVVIK
jgi:hypothetical protein